MKTTNRTIALTLIAHAVALVAFCLFGCASLTTQQTIGVASQIAAIELAHRISPAQKAQLANVLKSIAVQLRIAASKGVFSPTDLANAIRNNGVVNLSSDIQRYVSSAALLIQTQFAGVTVNAARVNSVAALFEETAALIQ